MNSKKVKDYLLKNRSDLPLPILFAKINDIQDGKFTARKFANQSYYKSENQSVKGFYKDILRF